MKTCCLFSVAHGWNGCFELLLQQWILLDWKWNHGIDLREVSHMLICSWRFLGMLKAVIFQKNLLFYYIFFLKLLPGAMADAVLEWHPMSCSNVVQCLVGVLLLCEYFWYFFYRKDILLRVAHCYTHVVLWSSRICMGHNVELQKHNSNESLKFLVGHKSLNNCSDNLLRQCTTPVVFAICSVVSLS